MVTRAERLLRDISTEHLDRIDEAARNLGCTHYALGTCGRGGPESVANASVLNMKTGQVTALFGRSLRPVKRQSYAEKNLTPYIPVSNAASHTTDDACDWDAVAADGGRIVNEARETIVFVNAGDDVVIRQRANWMDDQADPVLTIPLYRVPALIDRLTALLRDTEPKT